MTAIGLIPEVQLTQRITAIRTVKPPSIVSLRTTFPQVRFT
jgi:hypothetical protein